MENWFTPTGTGNPPKASRVWVLAPHPDDEVFGPGGTLIHYRETGARIDITIVTDGAGYSQSHESESSRLSVQMQRQSESAAAMRALRLSAPEFWDYSDRGLVDHVNALALRIQARLEQCAEDLEEIDVVLVPGLHEIHPDHAALARATVLALQRVSESESFRDSQPRQRKIPELLMYEVGSPIQPNLLVDISQFWSEKQQAMSYFTSQNQKQSYAKHIEALNIYRTYYLHQDVSHAEAFRWIKAEEFPNTFRPDSPDISRAPVWTNEVLMVAEAQAEQLQDQLILAQRTAELAAQRALADKQQLEQSHSKQMSELNDQMRLQGEGFRQELEKIHMHLGRLMEEREALRWERDHFAAEKGALTQDLLNQQHRYSKDVLELTASLHQTAKQNEILTQQLSLQQESTKLLQEQLQGLLNTWSWKMTRPLRWLGRFRG